MNDGQCQRHASLLLEDAVKLIDYSRVQVCESPKRHYLPRPGDAELDQFETVRRVGLPVSYRVFCREFGAGELSGYFRMACPLSVASDYDLATFDAQWHGQPEDRLLEHLGPPDFTKDLLFFCATIGGEAYAWKLSEVTAAVLQEYAIYFIPRSAPPLERVAATSYEFIVEVAGRSSGESDPTMAFTRFVS